MDFDNEAEESTAVAKLFINEDKFEDAKSKLHISQLFINKSEETFTFLLGPNFNYSQTYEINCTKDLQHEIIKLSFKRTQIEGSKQSSIGVGIGISAVFFLVAIGIIIAIIRWRQKLNPDTVYKEETRYVYRVQEYYKNSLRHFATFFMFS